MAYRIVFFIPPDKMIAYLGYFFRQENNLNVLGVFKFCPYCRKKAVGIKFFLFHILVYYNLVYIITL